MRAGVIVYSVLWLAVIVVAPASAANIEHGRILYEHNCTRCHDTSVHTRPNHRIGSPEALKNQVKRCEQGQAYNWSEPDIDDVAAYLAASFYKFGDAQK